VVAVLVVTCLVLFFFMLSVSDPVNSLMKGERGSGKKEDKRKIRGG
jgi:hypothetical protein